MSKKKNRVIEEQKLVESNWTKVAHEGCTACQSRSSLHVAIGQNGKVVRRFRADHRLTEAELKTAIEEFIAMRSRLG